MKALLAMEAEEGNVLDHEFIAAHTENFDAFAADLEATAWDDIETASGLSRSDLETGRDCLRQIECDHRHLRNGRDPAQ